MKPIVLASVVLLIGFFSLNFSPVANAQNENFDSFSSRLHRIKIGYPKSWSIVDFPGTTFAAVDDQTGKNINIIIIEAGNRSLQNVTQLNLEELKNNFPGLEVIEEKTGVINGANFTKTETKFYNPVIPGMQMGVNYCFVENNKAYIVSFGSTIEHREGFSKEIDAIVESIEIW